MASFESRQPPFADWPDVRRLHCIRQAHRSLVIHASVAIASAVILTDYSKVVATGPLREEVGSPYCLAVKKCLTRAVNWSKTHAGGKPVAFVFEHGAVGKGEVQTMFQQAKDDPTWGPFIGTLEFRGKDCVPL